MVFDWDGTLVDSAEPSFRCFVSMFRRFGIDFTREMYESTYSPNWYHTFQRVGLPEERWPEADRLWIESFACERPRLIDGAEETLARLKNDGVRAALVTNGTRSRIDREIVALGVDRYFDHVICGDDGLERKPHPAALQECLRRIDVEPHEAAYVGDSAEDMMMGHAAGVTCVGVRGPYPTHQTLAAADPHVIVDSIVDAIDALHYASR